MSDKNKKQKTSSEKFDIQAMLIKRQKTSEKMTPEDYINDKMPIYAANVNLRRQIPEIRDGLIPVQRRILFDLYQTRLYGGKRTKCAAVVGDTMKHFHPHGERVAVYKSIELLGHLERDNQQRRPEMVTFNDYSERK